MKKLTLIVSLILLVTIISALPAGAAGTSNGGWTPPEGMDIYYATDLTGKTAPMIDGVINADEYGAAIRMEDPLPMMQNYPDYIYKINDAGKDTMAKSEAIEFYFAFDENFFYIAFKDYGGAFTDNDATKQSFAARNNTTFYMGLQLDDMTNFFSYSSASTGWNVASNFSFSDGKLSNFSAIDETPKDFVSELYSRKYLASDPSLCFSKGDILSTENNLNAEEAYIAEVEIKISKATAVELFNKLAYTELETMPDAMYFTAKTVTYRFSADGQNVSDNNGHFRYFAKDIRGQLEKYFDYGLLAGSAQEYLPSLIVFGDENTVIRTGEKVEEVTTTVATETAATEPAATEPAATEPAATEPVETSPATIEEDVTEPAATEPAATEPATEGGCGGSVTLAGLALVAALGVCTTFVAKKKED